MANNNITYSSFTDSRDGKTYKTVQIGNLIWMAENLDYGGKNGELGVYPRNGKCVTKYGRLYSRMEAKKSAPTDWRLPKIDEWMSLVKKNKWSKIKALTGGLGYDIGPLFFCNVGEYGCWWSDNIVPKTFDSFYNVYMISNKVSVSCSDNFHLHSVRYVKDLP